MPITVEQVYGVQRNFQRQTIQEAQVAAVDYDAGGLLAEWFLVQTSDVTATVGDRVERTLEFTDIGGFDDLFPTQALQEAAVAELFTAVFGLHCFTPVRVEFASTVTP